MKIINFLREYSYPVLSLLGENGCVRTLHCTTTENKHRNPAVTTMTAFLTFKHHENSPTMKIINFLREYSYPVLSLPGENSLVRTLHCTTRDNKQILCTITTVTASLASKHLQNSLTILRLERYSYPVLSLPGESSLVRTLHCHYTDHYNLVQQRTNTEIQQ